MGGRIGADPDPCTGKEADPHPYIEGSRGTGPDLRIGGKLTLTPAQEKRRLTLTPPWEGGEWLTLILHVGELTLTPAQEEEKDWPRSLNRKELSPAQEGVEKTHHWCPMPLLCCLRGSTKPAASPAIADHKTAVMSRKGYFGLTPGAGEE